MLKKSVFIFLVIFVVLISVLGCSKKKDNIKVKTYFDMGTIVQIAYEESMEKHIDDVVRYMGRMASIISNTQYIIEHTDINKPVKVPQEFIEVYKYAEEYYNISGGAYDPTTMTVASLYGFPYEVLKEPDNESLNKAYKSAGFDKFKLVNNTVIKTSNGLLDLSANSKGYIVDKTAEYMKKLGFKNFLVNAGGDLYVSGFRNGKIPFDVSVEDPENKGSASVINLNNKAVATSGNYERYFINSNNERITHIFSGIDFKSKNNYQSMSVIADTTEKADGLATLYFLSDIEKIKFYCEKYKTPVFIIALDNSKIKLCGWEKYEKK